MLRYVDHVIFAVDDLEGAARDYDQKLGFAVSAGGVHPGAGTHNRLIVLDPAYVELIARLPETTLRPGFPISYMFARAPGPLGYVLNSDDLDADVSAIRARGLTVEGPHIGRLEGPDGSARGWRVAWVGADERLGAEHWRLPFIIQHDSDGAERLRRIAAPGDPLPHPVGARRLSHVTLAVHDLEAGMRCYERAFGLRADVTGIDAALQARTARIPLPQNGAIVLATPLQGDGPIARALQAGGEGLFSATIVVDYLQDAVTRLREQGVGVQVDEPEGVLVAGRIDMASAHGGRLELVRA
jgi:catechol 2,3-dioxygenase-like lactoylglutathione lyase family enzyme